MSLLKEAIKSPEFRKSVNFWGGMMTVIMLGNGFKDEISNVVGTHFNKQAVVQEHHKPIDPHSLEARRLAAANIALLAVFNGAYYLNRKRKEEAKSLP